MGMYTIYFGNFGYAKNGFTSIKDALDAIKASSFEASVIEDKTNTQIAYWTPFGGTRYFQ
jgi:hypothetical protein